MIRLGRVTTVETNRIVLEDGTVDADPDTLYVDCSAAALGQPPPGTAVFEPGVVNLLVTRQIQPVFSAALTGFIESRFDDDEKNAMCQVVPYPTVPLDWLTMWLPTLSNSARWAQRPDVAKWMTGHRLNASAAALRGLDPADPRRHQMRDLLRDTAVKAVANISRLLPTVEDVGRVNGAGQAAPERRTDVREFQAS